MTERDKCKKTFVKAYKMAWYNKGQLYGEYLWDVPFESYDGDMSSVEEIALNQYGKL